MRRIFVVSILSLFLVGAGTTIYAKSNSAENLSDWYKGAFQQKGEILGSITAVEIITLLADFNQFMSESKKSFDGVIATLFEEKTSNTQSEIEMQHSELVNELNATVSDLQQENFDAYVDELTIEVELTMEVEKMLEELLNE